MIVHENLPLKDILYYKIGGPARFVLEIHNAKDVSEAIAFIHKNSITNVMVIGSGSNLLMRDQGFDGAVLWFTKPEDGLELRSETTINAFASIWFDDLLQFSFKHSLVGLEWAGGLPSTVGAAVRGNVGAFGGEIKDSIIEADVIDVSEPGFQIKTLSNADLNFGYRESSVKKNKQLVIISATFALNKADPEQLSEAIEEYDSHKAYRKERHPVEYPSCGSVFKNIVGSEKVDKIVAVWPDINESVQGKWHGKVSIGYIIDRLGFTGKRIGDAQISEKHSNYIINLGNANASDVLELITEIKETFTKTFGFHPETEVEIVA